MPGAIFIGIEVGFLNVYIGAVPPAYARQASQPAIFGAFRRIT